MFLKNEKNKIFAYENFDGDKGIIIAETYEEAEKLYKEDYPDCTIIDGNEDYRSGTGLLFEVRNKIEKGVVNAFPW